MPSCLEPPQAWWGMTPMIQQRTCSLASRPKCKNSIRAILQNLEGKKHIFYIYLYKVLHCFTNKLDLEATGSIVSWNKYNLMNLNYYYKKIVLIVKWLFLYLPGFRRRLINKFTKKSQIINFINIIFSRHPSLLTWSMVVLSYYISHWLWPDFYI